MKLISAFLLLLPTLLHAEMTSYFCNYTSYSDQAGNHEVKNKFELKFIVDKASKKTILVGNNGSDEVKLLETNEQLAFIEITPLGNIMTTSIDRELNSVHSRNFVDLIGEMMPSQYYGKCDVK